MVEESTINIFKTYTNLLFMIGVLTHIFITKSTFSFKVVMSNSTVVYCARPFKREFELST